MTTMTETNTEAGVGTLLNTPPKKSAFAFGSCIDNSSTAWAMSATTLLLAELKADMKAIRAELKPKDVGFPPPPPSPVSLALPPRATSPPSSFIAGPSPRLDQPPAPAPKAFYTPQKRPHVLKPLNITGGKWKAPQPMGFPATLGTAPVAQLSGADMIDDQSRQARIAMKSKAIHEMLMKAQRQEVQVQLASTAVGPHEVCAQLAAPAA